MNRANKGFAIVETLLAFALFAVLLLAVVPLFLTAVRSNASAFDYTTVNALARDKLEQLMNVPISDASLRIPGGQTQVAMANDLEARINPVTGMPSTDPSHPIYPYERTWRVELYDVDASNNLVPVSSGNRYTVKRITVSVTSVRGSLPGMRRIKVSGLRHNPDPTANVL
jgi:type II secretory pathway pseudopilin PulG